MKGRVQPATWITAAALLVLLVLALGDLGFFDAQTMRLGFSNVGRFARELVPPDLDPSLLADLVAALATTVEMAFAGTLLGAAVGLPLAVLAARPLAGTATARVVRVVLAFVRTVPSLLWALLFVVIVGLGPVAGVLGLAIYTVGYVGKLWYEALEGLDPDVLEAVRAVGATRLQLVGRAALPEAANALLSQLLYAFEYNVRASSILGLVGAGGIGFYLAQFLDRLEYRKLTTAILLTFVVVVAIDGASRRIRRRFLLAQAPAPE